MDTKEHCYVLNQDIEKFITAFIERYFCDEEGNFEGEFYIYEEDYSDMLNYNLFVNWYGFDLPTMYYAMWYNIPYSKLMERYDYETCSLINWEEPANLKNWYLANNEE